MRIWPHAPPSYRIAGISCCPKDAVAQIDIFVLLWRYSIRNFDGGSLLLSVISVTWIIATLDAISTQLCAKPASFVTISCTHSSPGTNICR